MTFNIAADDNVRLEVLLTHLNEGFDAMAGKKSKDEGKNKASFTLDLDQKAAARFMEILEDEGLMRAGFVIHESNNMSVTIESEGSKPPAKP